MTPKRSDGAQAQAGILRVPAYNLYGEAREAAVYGFFHIEYLEVRNVPNQWRIGSHIHPDFDQLSILFDGRCTYTHDGKVGEAPSSSCVYTPADVVHHFAYQPNSNGVVISVSPDFAFGLPDEENAARSALLRLASWRLAVMNSSSGRRVKLLADMLFERSTYPAGNRREVVRHMFAALVLEINSCLGHDQTEPAAVSSSAGAATLFHRYLGLVKKEIAAIGYAVGEKAVTVEQFAERLSTTAHALNAACQAVSEKSARDVIQQMLGEQARRLLLYTTHSVKEISFLLGYSHPSHFVRFFRQTTKMTPLEFRTAFVRDHTD